MVSYGKGRSSQAGREAEGQLLGRRPAPSAEGHLGRVGAASPAGERLLALRRMFRVHSPRAEQAVPLPVSLLLEPNMVGQGSRKTYSHLCFCSYK